MFVSFLISRSLGRMNRRIAFPRFCFDIDLGVVVGLGMSSRRSVLILSLVVD